MLRDFADGDSVFYARSLDPTVTVIIMYVDFKLQPSCYDYNIYFDLSCYHLYRIWMVYGK